MSQSGSGSKEPAGNRIPIFQPVASHCTERAVSDPKEVCNMSDNLKLCFPSS
jgi:hypothetical protein